MKLRFENHSIRFRVRKSELQQLKEKNVLQETISFPNGSFVYELRIADIPSLKPVCKNNTIAVEIPLIRANSWINTDEVGIYELITIDDDEALEIIIEKDFPCNDRPGEDKEDTFSELAARQPKGNSC